MSNQITKNPQAELRALCEKPAVKNRIEELLGRRAPQFVTTLIQIQLGSYQLKQCDPATILGAGMTAASMDLPTNPNLGFAHIVPYAGKAQFQMGYKGYIQLGLRSGQFAAINEFVIPNGCLKSYNELTGDLQIDWEKVATEPKGDADGYAVYFRLTNGFEKTVFWTRSKVEAHAKRFSQAYKAGKKDSPWITDFDAMAMKTVIKFTFSRYAPLSIEMQTAIERDSAVIDAEGKADYIDNPDKQEVNPFARQDDDTVDAEFSDIPANKNTEAADSPGSADDGTRVKGNADNNDQRSGTDSAASTPPVQNSVGAIKELMLDGGISDSKLLAWCVKNKLCEKGDVKSITQLPADDIEVIIERWDEAKGDLA